MIHKNFSSVRLIACSLLLVLFFVSCRKEAMDIQSPNNRPCTSYLEQFEAIWEGLDHTYVMWDQDTVDWDARYEKYRPIFASFDANGVDSATYVNTWKGVINGLLDHHMTLFLWNPSEGHKYLIKMAPHRPSRVTKYATQVEILKRQSGISNFIEYSDTTGKYVSSVFCLLPGKSTGKHIAYLRLSEFNMSTLFDKSAPADARAPFRAFYGDGDTAWFTGVTNGAVGKSDVESIIIDLRGNPGGSVSEISPFIGSLLQNMFHWGYTRYKQGLNRMDYTGWEPLEFECPRSHLKEAKPIVVLSDANSVSCAELSTYILKTIPNGTFIGESTYGGTCALSPNTDVTFNLFYTGCFGDQQLYEKNKPTHPEDFSYFMYSGTYQVVTTEYKSLEGVGVTPDIEVPYNDSELSAGVDSQLNRALQYLRTGK